MAGQIGDQSRNHAYRVSNVAISNGGTVASAAVDTRGVLEATEIPITLSDRASGTGAVTVSVKHSEASGSGYVAVDADWLTNKDGDADTFDALGTSGSTQTLWLATSGLYRYVRLEFAGTTFSHNLAVVMDLTYADGAQL